jgi:hypothetical protein
MRHRRRRRRARENPVTTGTKVLIGLGGALGLGLIVFFATRKKEVKQDERIDTKTLPPDTKTPPPSGGDQKLEMRREMSAPLSTVTMPMFEAPPNTGPAAP